MLRRLHAGVVLEIRGCKRSACISRRWSFRPESVHVQQSVRWLSETNAAQRTDADNTPYRTPGTPAPGREQTLGEAFAAMQYHGRGKRKVKAKVLYNILERVSSEDELKYAHLGLELFKKQEIKLSKKAGSLFLKACCKAGSPQAAVHALEEAEKYGLHEESVVSANRFNYLLSQLYKAGDEDSFRRAVAEARSRPEMLNGRSHFLIDSFEAESRARAEEERKMKEAEEQKARLEKAGTEAEEKSGIEVEEAKADQEAEETKA
ncbi:unnamed protein product [Ascophyllum nodosum]